MLNARNKIITSKIIEERIALFAGAICTADEAIGFAAAIQLAQIGTKESADTLMFLIEQIEHLEERKVMIDILITFSPLRNNYRERLASIRYDDEAIEAAYAAIEQSKDLLSMKPLWQEIAEAIEAAADTCGDKCTCTRA